MICKKLYTYQKIFFLAVAAFASATIMAQVPGSALDYMLQRPRVSKLYQHKRPFDHFFVDAGLGLNGIGVSGLHFGPQGSFGFGDWITPEHGLRLKMNAGVWNIPGKKVKVGDVALDYLLNITALSQQGTYYTPRCFELMGVFGVNGAFSRYDGNWEKGLGLHVGLRGQLALSNFTYAFLEPNVGIMDDKVSQEPTWHGYRPYGNVVLGLGYRLTGNRLGNKYDGKGFSDGLFFSVMGGGAFLLNGQPETWKDRFGGRAMFSVGKWFDPYNAVRLSAVASSIKQDATANNLKAFGLQLDYMANMHNLFGGLNPDRKFWMNFVAGVSYNISSANNYSLKNSFGVGGGLQANIKLAHGLALSLEPRIDAYNQYYAPSASSFNNTDMAVSFLAGLTYTYNDRRAAHVSDVDDIRHSTITVAGGLSNRLNSLSDGRMYSPVGRISFTRWYSPAFAWRANAQALTDSKRDMDHSVVRAVVGADWMADLTALSCGYDRSRVLSFKTIAGFNVGADYSKKGNVHTYFSPDVHIGGQVAVRLADNFHVVVEPQVAYEFSNRYSSSYVERFAPSLAVGLEYSMFRNEAKADVVDKPNKPHFVSVSLGSGLYTGNYVESLASRNRWSFVGEVGFGQWLNGISGLHVSLSNTTVQRGDGYEGNHNITSLNAGYMMNIKSAVTGDASDDDAFRLIGIADLSLVGSNRKDHNMKVTMGGKLAVQAGVALSRNVEVYLEPSASIYGSGVEFNSKNHPIEADARLSLGTKWNF